MDRASEARKFLAMTCIIFLRLSGCITCIYVLKYRLYFSIRNLISSYTDIQVLQNVLFLSPAIFVWRGISPKKGELCLRAIYHQVRCHKKELCISFQIYVTFYSCKISFFVPSQMDRSTVNINVNSQCDSCSYFLLGNRSLTESHV